MRKVTTFLILFLLLVAVGCATQRADAEVTTQIDNDISGIDSENSDLDETTGLEDLDSDLTAIEDL